MKNAPETAADTACLRRILNMADESKRICMISYRVSKRMPSVFGPQWQEIVQLAFVIWTSLNCIVSSTVFFTRSMYSCGIPEWVMNSRSVLISGYFASSSWTYFTRTLSSAPRYFSLRPCSRPGCLPGCRASASACWLPGQRQPSSVRLREER